MLQRGLRRPGRADLLCRQGQLQPGRACARWRGSAPAWTWSRRASCAARCAAGVPADKIIFAGVGKTREEMAYALSEGILGFNVESEPELRRAERGGGGPRAHGAHRAARQPRRRRQDARQDLDRQGREQVRHSLSSEARAALRQGRASCRASRSPASTCTSAARSPTWQPFRDAFPLMRELAQTLRADGHALEHLDLGGGLGVPYRRRQRRAAARRRPTPQVVQARRSAISA